jgi:hypothetical protein
MSCLKADGIKRSFEELILRAFNEYNFTFHSNTGISIIQAYFGSTPDNTPAILERIRQDNIEKLKQKQIKDLINNTNNKKRQPIKNYVPG